MKGMVIQISFHALLIWEDAREWVVVKWQLGDYALDSISGNASWKEDIFLSLLVAMHICSTGR
jgi:hypothetical protein